MRFFRRRDDEPVDMNERSPQLGLKYKDLAILDQLMKNGADLTQSRHVLYYSYAPSEDVARVMQQEAESGGFSASVRDPLPEFPGQWPSSAKRTRSLRPTSSGIRTTSSRLWPIVTGPSTTAGKRAFDDDRRRLAS
jgi:hypothetical protein